MTSEEIVKSLRCCAEIGECEKCVIDPEESWDTCRKRDAEAAELIERLEKEKAALMEGLRGGCTSCKHWPEDTIDCKVFEGCTLCRKDCKCKDCDFGNNWEWKGLEDGNGTTNL